MGPRRLTQVEWLQRRQPPRRLGHIHPAAEGWRQHPHGRPILGQIPHHRYRLGYVQVGRQVLDRKLQHQQRGNISYGLGFGRQRVSLHGRHAKRRRSTSGRRLVPDVLQQRYPYR